jgi:hypothetical protein
VFPVVLCFVNRVIFVTDSVKCIPSVSPLSVRLVADVYVAVTELTDVKKTNKQTVKENGNKSYSISQIFFAICFQLSPQESQ